MSLNKEIRIQELKRLKLTNYNLIADLLKKYIYIAAFVLCKHSA